MITVNKAVLHILDFNSDITVYSQEELDLQNQTVITFLNKHIEKSIGDSDLRNGEFFSDSYFKIETNRYLHNDTSFLDFSVVVAEKIYSAISRSDKLDSTDLLFCDFSDESNHYIGILECNNKTGYTHQVLKDGNKIKNEIINHYAILPNPSQKLDGYAFINLNTGAIKFTDKKRMIEGKDVFVLPDMILQCSSSISPKDTVKLVSSIAYKIAEQHGQNSTIAVSKAKNYIVENAEISDNLEPTELGREVFESSEVMQDEFIEEIKRAGMPEMIKMDKAFAVRTGRNHKIKTDTGIEITFPVDYYENHDYIEFINNPDGTLSIELKNIGKITNR